MPSASWRSQLAWAARTAFALGLSAALLYCGDLKRVELPSASFAAFVAVLTVQANLGATLRTSTDVLCGAVLAAFVNLPTLALPASVRRDRAFCTALLFAQMFAFAHAEMRLASRRLALSCGTILALAPIDSTAAVDPVYTCKFMAMVAIAVACSIAGALVPPIDCARLLLRHESASVASVVSDCFAELVEVFCGGRRLVKASFLLQLARPKMSTLGALSSDAEWEPCCCQRSQDDATLGHAASGKATRHLSTMVAALQLGTRNGGRDCQLHGTFARRLHTPLRALVAASEAGQGTSAISELMAAFQLARELALYSDERSVDDVAQYQSEYAAIVNTFLLAAMQFSLAVAPAASAPSVPMRQSVADWCCALHKQLWAALTLPSASALVDRTRLERGLKFSLSITLASLVLHLPGETFQYAIFAPVEVTFIIFDRVGASVNQSVMRIIGSAVGSVAGYLAASACQGSDIALLLMLIFWAFIVALGRASTQGYAFCVAAWTAAIVGGTASGGASDGERKEVAIERITHAFLGAAIMLLVVHAIFPRWARDDVRGALAKLISEGAEVLATEVRQWQQQLGNEDTRARAAEKLTPAGSPPEGLARLQARVESMQQRLSSLAALHEEARAEPELWRGPYATDAIGAVVGSVGKLLGALVTVLETQQAQQLGAIVDGGLHLWMDPHEQFWSSLEALAAAAEATGAALAASVTDPSGSVEHAVTLDEALTASSKQRADLCLFYQRALAAAMERGLADAALRVSSADMLLHNSLFAAMLGACDAHQALGRAVATLGEVDSVLSEMGRKKASDKRRRSLTSSLSLTTIEAVPEPPAPSMSSV